MSPSPYRSPAEDAVAPEGFGTSLPDGELLPVFLVVWLASVVRVSLGVARGETFGTEATLAVMAVAILPLLSRNALRALVANRWRGRRATMGRGR